MQTVWSQYAQSWDEGRQSLQDSARKRTSLSDQLAQQDIRSNLPRCCLSIHSAQSKKLVQNAILRQCHQPKRVQQL